MEKYSLYPGKTTDGSPRIHLIEPGSTYGTSSTSGLEKTASGEHLPEVLELIESIKPQEGRLYLVNSALGAGEYVGFNLRGDWFTEQGLLHTPDHWAEIPVWDIDARRRAANWTEEAPGWGNLCWGFPTFYNAHRFRHHSNKDPNKAYGFILGAFWDPRMHRVILVSELIRENCARLGALDLYSRIERGEFPDTSMGAKVPYDRCAICGNVAKSPANYCEHVHKNARHPYGMRQILPDGRMCGVYNDYPRFFDDSFVFIGAERSAKTMSNFTSMVKGDRGYTQEIHPYVPPTRKIASAPTEREDQWSNIRNTAREISEVPADDSPQGMFSRLLSGVSLSGSPQERMISRHLEDDRKAKARVVSGDMSPQEYNRWRSIELTLMDRAGVGRGEISSLEKRLKAEALSKALPNTKVATSTKWAEMLKRFPAPTPGQISIIRKHTDSMPDLPIRVLDRASDDPGIIRALAKLGIILRPHEFQHVLLKNTHPEECREHSMGGRVFRPLPVDPLMSPRYTPFLPHPPLGGVMELLGSLLRSRSFAPQAVRIRIIEATPVKEASAGGSIPTEDPLLDEVSRTYNEYRAGLVARPADWRYVSLKKDSFGGLQEELKLADASQELSRQLLYLAYWPALFVG